MTFSDQPRDGDGRFGKKVGSPPLPLQTGVLTRQEVADGLRDIMSRLRDMGERADVHLMGGVAIAFTIDSNRPPTRDVDAEISPPDMFRTVSEQVGKQRGWRDDWLDENVHVFIPNQFGKGAEWVTLYDDGDGRSIKAASPKMLLAMKLRAMESRPRRDAGDVHRLLAATDVKTADEAEAILEDFFPGDGLSPRTYGQVQALLESGPPPMAKTEAPTFD